jgi:hypothetical protein
MAAGLWRVSPRPEPDPVEATVATIGVSIAYTASLGNDVAARGWLKSLARLVDDFGLELPLRLSPRDPVGSRPARPQSAGRS